MAASARTAGTPVAGGSGSVPTVRPSKRNAPPLARSASAQAIALTGALLR